MEPLSPRRVALRRPEPLIFNAPDAVVYVISVFWRFFPGVWGGAQAAMLLSGTGHLLRRL